MAALIARHDHFLPNSIPPLKNFVITEECKRVLMKIIKSKGSDLIISVELFFFTSCSVTASLPIKQLHAQIQQKKH